MTDAFDNRIVSVGIEINGETMIFEGLDIHASGLRNTTPTEATATIVISNLTRAHRNYILTKASPFIQGKDQKPLRVWLDVGRESYGTFRLFDGGCWAMGATQPPDIGIVLESTANLAALNIIASTSFGGTVPLKTIAQKIADKNKLTLEYKVKNDKKIANYSYSGSVGREIQQLATMGGVKAYIAENNTLVVIDADAPRSDTTVLIDLIGGMVGVPQATASGVIVRTLVNSAIKIGNNVEIISEINPAVNGKYRVETIQFDIANRHPQFFYTLYCTNTFMTNGTQ